MYSNISIFLSFIIALLTIVSPVFAGPVSTNFQLEEYGFGAGGVASASSQNFLFQGIAGEVETASASSANFLALPGLTYTLEPSIPPAPTFTNPSNYYNKLHIVIGTGGNPTDATYAIAVSTDNFVSDINYVQTDNTLGTLLTFQSYVSWGSGTGIDIVGLTPGQTYYAKVAARRGTFQQGAFGAVSNATTSNPSFTFDIDTTSQSVPPFSVFVGQLTAGNVTTSSDKVTTTITTNATGGGLVYIFGTNAGLQSSLAGNYVISSGSNDLSSILEGYGARGTTTSQSSGGPMELVSPYNGAGENVGVLDTSKRLFADSSSLPVTSGQATFELKAKAKNTTPSASDYSDVLTVIATGSF
jgi:hypothetical protein